MAAFDATTLLVALAPPELVQVRIDGAPIPDARRRVDHLIETLERSKTKIVIPTPALSEALVRAGQAAAQAYVDRLSKAAAFRIAPFDEIAALEAAAMLREAWADGDKKGGASGNWQKIKVDRQIIAIAKVCGARTIYSNDEDIRLLAPRAGLRVVGIEDLPLPDPTPQSLQLDIFKTPETGQAGKEA